MSRTISVDPESGDVVVEFRFDRALKDRVKALPGARFHWGSKTWRFPADRASAVVSALAPQGFALLDESLGDAPAGTAAADSSPARPDGEVAPPPADTLTVSSLNGLLAEAIIRRFPDAVWVCGTLAEYERGAHRAHVWCRVVEEDPDGRPLSVVSAVIFSSARERIERRLADAGLGLSDGLPVRLLGRVELYAPRGTLQLVIEDVDPAWSVGDLALRREEVLRELRAAGLHERQLDLPMPALPRRIALVSSAGSDAYHDVLSSLRNGGYGLEVVPFDVRVQGPDLSATVCAALDAIAADGGYDLIVITRGGGSRVELAGWDDLRVAMTVARLPIKVLVAIGHHQDRSVLDDIATSAKTPTEAGEWIVGLWARAEQDLVEQAQRLEATVRRRLAVETRHLGAYARSVEVAARASMLRSREATVRARTRLETGLRARMRLARLHVERLEPRLSPRAVQRGLRRRAEAVDTLERRLERAAARGVRHSAGHLGELSARLRLVHPDNVLRRGFAIVRGSDGAPITTVDAISVGDGLRVQMRDGHVDADVRAVDPDPNGEERD